MENSIHPCEPPSLSLAHSPYWLARVISIHYVLLVGGLPTCKLEYRNIHTDTPSKLFTTIRGQPTIDIVLPRFNHIIASPLEFLYFHRMKYDSIFKTRLQRRLLMPIQIKAAQRCWCWKPFTPFTVGLNTINVLALSTKTWMFWSSPT